jgi:hypothetical protein
VLLFGWISVMELHQARFMWTIKAVVTCCMEFWENLNFLSKSYFKLSRYACGRLFPGFRDQFLISELVCWPCGLSNFIYVFSQGFFNGCGFIVCYCVQGAIFLKSMTLLNLSKGFVKSWFQPLRFSDLDSNNIVLVFLVGFQMVSIDFAGRLFWKPAPDQT